MYDLDLDQDHLKASLVPTVFEAQVHLLDFSLKFSPIVPTVGIIKKKKEIIPQKSSGATDNKVSTSGAEKRSHFRLMTANTQINCRNFIDSPTFHIYLLFPGTLIC